MKLASLRSSRLDGELVVVSRDLARMVRVGEIAPTLQAALEDWGRVKPLLEARYHHLMDFEGRGTLRPFGGGFSAAACLSVV